MSTQLDHQQVLQASYDSSNGALKVTQAGTLTPSSYDYMVLTNPNATTEVYTYKTGGSSGVTVGTVTIVYTDSTKATLSTVTRT